MAKYGNAAKYEFDNPQKWVTEYSVPLLDEHEMTDESGRPVTYVDRSVLERIAQNNNERVKRTGDPATLILGHTSDDPSAPEKPAKGFAVNYHVKPYSRDPKTGQVIYAIHADFKVRPQNAKILEEYPRRSVELWWNKKELDPIALLGGTSPERDLGVVIRNTRLNHIAMDRVPADPRLREAIARASNVLQFSTRGNWTIETYNCPTKLRYAKGDEKVHKVMSEFKSGELHSGSKSGPKVTNRKQAIAIALSEAGKSKPKRYEEECDMPDKYAANQFGDEGADDLDDTNQYDPGDEMPDTDDMGGDSAENDPVVAKVFQSKQWKELSEKLDMILAAIEGPEAGMGGEGGPGMEEPGMDEMPPPAPPGGDGMGMGGPPPGGGGYGDEEEGPPPEEESRRAKGQQPVQFMSGPPSTGMAGPTSTAIPTFGKKYSKSNSTSNKSQTPKKGETMPKVNNELAAMRRELNEYKLKFARSEAAQIVNRLESDGVLFGDSPEEVEQTKNETIEYLAYLGMQSQEDRDHEVQVIAKRYKRRKANPASPTSIGLARFARNPGKNGNGSGAEVGGEEDDWAPRNAMEASDYADLITVKKLSRPEAIKFMRKNRAKYEEYDLDLHTDDRL